VSKNLLAFFLAALTVTVFLSGFVYLDALTEKPLIQVTIRSKEDVAPIVAAINGLHRSDITIRTEKPAQYGITTILGAAVFEALGLMFFSACVAALYKFYCRKLGVTATL
jgi:uncharacterized membrane-anchored protein